MGTAPPGPRSGSDMYTIAGEDRLYSIHNLQRLSPTPSWVSRTYLTFTTWEGLIVLPKINMFMTSPNVTNSSTEKLTNES